MKVALVGGCPNSEYLAPFSDKEWDIWVHGNQMNRHENRRVSRIFEIHDDLSEHPPQYAPWIAEKKIPMIVGRNFPIKADHISVFPFDKANAIMGQHLTSTPAYMMALAIIEGATEIGIYGVDMSVDDHEYFHQRPTMYAWVGYARGLGIKVTIPKESSLFIDKYVEGAGAGNNPDFEQPPFTEKEFLGMVKLHEDKISSYEQEILDIQAKVLLIQKTIHSHDGARQAYARLAKVSRSIESGVDIDSLIDTALIK